VTALTGLRRGLVVTAFSLAGVVVGAVVGARVAPHFLEDGAHSDYTALVGLGGAMVGMAAFQLFARFLGGIVRGGLRFMPPLQFLDSLGGLAVGVVWGLTLVWVAGAVALQLPGHPKVRREVRQSEVIHRLNRVAPPRDILLVRKHLGTIVSGLHK
jgi:Colicin V production protein